jgi:hypothetical protein
MQSLSVTALFMLLFLTACGGSQKRLDIARDSLATSLTATTAARDAFLDWDRGHQIHLAETAPSQEAGAAALAAYRKKKQTVLTALTAAYSSIAAAAGALALAGEGVDVATLAQLTADAMKAFAAVQQAIAQTRGAL